MTITKDELHKLIDSIDMNKLNDKKDTISIATCGFGLALTHILKECQKPKELTLHEKLINAGGILTKRLYFNNYEFANKIEVAIKEKDVYIFDSINSRKNCLMFTNENNDAKVFEAIDFLTKWQS